MLKLCLKFHFNFEKQKYNTLNSGGYIKTTKEGIYIKKARESVTQSRATVKKQIEFYLIAAVDSRVISFASSVT